MIIFLRGQNVLGIVDGLMPCPIIDHPRYDLWTQCNDIALSWIHATLSMAVYETLLNFDSQSTFAAWTILGQLFLDNASATQMHSCQKFQHFEKGPCYAVVSSASQKPSHAPSRTYSHINQKLRGKFSKGKSTHNGSYGQKQNAYSKFNANITAGILGHSPSMAPPLKASAKCQICGLYNHEALDCNDRFNHAYASTKLHKSLTAMHLDECANTIWYPDCNDPPQVVRP
ncbi:hypothetical protein LIER_16025 [Lithospermum erythrorhizon]|uniref:Retrotransposon Copia-like N-terminal domain-containing protein n=1 Tax=Lithospermum erythrorhizon TaxID=34254 RepID=A0AAV3Q612_LITER